VNTLARAIAVLLACWAAFGAHASDPQSPLGVGAIVTPTEHQRPGAWLILPQTPPAADVFHLPPRDGVGGIEDGVARLAGSLRSMPRFVAARGERLYMVFETPTPPAFEGTMKPRPRQVLSVGAVLDAQNRWVTIPQGRLDVEPSLTGDGRLLGFAGSDAGLFALLQDAGGVRLLELRGREWTPLDDVLPSDTLRLFGVPGGVGVVLGRARDVSIGLGVRKSPTDALAWTWSAAEGAVADAAREGAIGYAGGHVVVAGRTGEDTVVVRARPTPWSAGTWREVGRIGGVSGAYALCPIDAAGRVVIAIAPEPGQARALPMLHEVSIGSGRTLFAGPMRLQGPVGRIDLALLLAMFAVLAFSIAITVMPVRETSVVIPEGSSLAEPFRRFAAGMIDLSLVVTGLLLAAPREQAWSGEWWLSPAGQVSAIVALLIAGLTFGVFEWLTGRTPGKLVTGCRVVTVRPEPGDTTARPSLAQALLRSVLTWWLPPVGLLALLDPSGRPRADQLSRTAVVVDAPPEPADE
jgi:hypothetical protein